ncbi:hypothetical protein [Paenibacillus sp. 1P07SE]|uniref:hypothetical protein n=1 Tax=Paenibacillus sp. 1P07SE TaxID=3132209 RepID=UPI0039A5FF18
MYRSDQYYCVGCGRMENLEEAQLLFRTGFFRIVHPLGCCVRCSGAEQGMQDLSYPLADSDPTLAGRHHIASPSKERKELAYAY